jgi:hypothetical protein
MKKSIVICLIISIFTTKNFGKAYHVSTSGNDTNSGSSGAPFRTIQKAALVMSAGDTCYIHAGTYYEYIKPANSGVAGNRMVFTAYLNDTVTVHGGKQLTG